MTHFLIYTSASHALSILMHAFQSLILLAFLAASLSVHAEESPYRVVQRLPLSGDGGWDYPSVDSERHLLYLSRADHVSIVDTLSGKLAAEIGDTLGVHGIALASDLNRGFISCGKANVVKVFDLKTRVVLATVAVGNGPDAITYEPITQRVFVFNGRGHSATVIDANSNTVLATIALGGKPEFARADGRGQVLVNIEDTAELVVLDAKTSGVAARWLLPHCDEPSGLAFDALHRRSFSTCGNQLLTVLNVDNGKLVASIPIGKSVDGAEFDPVTQNVYTANGEGTMTIVHEQSLDTFLVQQTLVTQRGARTIALDPGTHQLYLPTAEFGPLPQATADNPHPRSPVLNGTFVVLVVAETIQ